MFVFNDSELDMSNIEPSVFAAGLDTKSQTCKWIPNGLFTYNITLPFTLYWQHQINDNKKYSGF